MDWYRIELPPNDAVSFESRWLVLYSKRRTPAGLFIFRGRRKSGRCQFFVPEPVRHEFPSFFGNYQLEKCDQPKLATLEPIGGSKDEVEEFYTKPLA